MRLASVILLTRLAAVAGCVVGPVVYANYQQKQTKNFKVVRDGVLLRSGQMTAEGLRRVVHDHGVRTVVSLRDARNPGDPAPDRAEEEYCNRVGIRFVRLTPKSWEGPAGRPAPVQPNVDAFREIIDDPRNYPVLVHCFAGVHRTGAYCAIYRMEQEGWTNEEAMAEMRAQGYENLQEELDIFGFLSRYRPKRER